MHESRILQRLRLACDVENRSHLPHLLARGECCEMGAMRADVTDSEGCTNLRRIEPPRCSFFLVGQIEGPFLKILNVDLANLAKHPGSDHFACLAQHGMSGIGVS